MGDQGLTQTVQFSVNELYLLTSKGSFDITMVFEELNIFDNMFTPCMSGNVMVKDSNNIIDNLNIDGGEYIKISIDKGEDNPSYFGFEKMFRIYKISNISNNNFTTKTFILHFVSDEYILSEQKKISQSYSGLYSDFVKNILTKELKISPTTPKDGKAGIQSITQSKGIVDIIVPVLTPFDSIEWISKRAVSKTLPDFVFYETQFGYSFVSLGSLMSSPATADINFNPKSIDNDIMSEMVGARRFKVISSFHVADNTTNGVYAGKFSGFDTLTRTNRTTNIDYIDKVFSKMDHPNKNPILPTTKDSNQYDSRIVVYPYAEPRTTNQYIKGNNTELSSKIDNTQDYIFQRKSIFYALMQRRIQIVLPGNFYLCTGKIVNILLPNYTSNDGSREPVDASMSGNYIILGTRHTVRFDRHETIIEVATDSTNK